MLRRRSLRRDVRDFVLAGTPTVPEAWVRTAELLPAVLTYLRVGRRFRRDGLLDAARAIPAARGPRGELHPDLAAAGARSAAGRILGLARTLGGRHLCLHESLAITAALRRLGFQAQTIIGYPVIEGADGDEELHAWPQVGEVTVTDRLGSAPLNFVELVRYPHSPPVARGPSRA
jgi:hypothetical protein